MSNQNNRPQLETSSIPQENTNLFPLINNNENTENEFFEESSNFNRNLDLQIDEIYDNLNYIINTHKYVKAFYSFVGNL